MTAHFNFVALSTTRRKLKIFFWENAIKQSPFCKLGKSKLDFIVFNGVSRWYLFTLNKQHSALILNLWLNFQEKGFEHIDYSIQKQ